LSQNELDYLRPYLLHEELFLDVLSTMSEEEFENTIDLQDGIR